VNERVAGACGLSAAEPDEAGGIDCYATQRRGM